MVHALSEIHRVLAPGGVMVDLRPLLDQWPIEIYAAGGHREIGKVMDLEEAVADDVAANAAMTRVVSGMGFRREREQAFSFFYYWDTPREMKDYITENWDDVLRVDDTVWSQLGSAWASGGAEARVRLRVRLLIARYRTDR